MSSELILASAIFGPEGHVWRGVKPYGVVDTPDYLRMNPNGTVPTIDDDGVIIWESNAIVSYIAMRYAPALFGGQPTTFGRSACWMGWCNSSFNSPLGGATAHLFRLPPVQRESERLRQAEREMAPILKIIDDALIDSAYVAGDTLTIGDIALAPFVRRWYCFDLARPKVPHVDAWLARLEKRPGYVRHVLPRDVHIDPE